MDRSQSGLRILFADDETHLRDLMRNELPRMGHDVTVCPDGLTAVRALEKASYDAALLDIRMPGLTGIEVLERSRQICPETQVVLLTGQASVDTAVQALRLGAFDYLTKPCKWAELEVVLKRIAERRDLTNKAAALESRLKASEGGFPIMIGDTSVMQSIMRLIDTVAPTDASIMILGETGTGKELVARSLHEKSHRCSNAFIPVNCGALPEHLVESELFGHRKGAFTGADTNRKGLFEVANGGTLFLDEVGELNKAVQVKLLRFLESGEIRRVGENEPFRVDVRVLCATNRDLLQMIDEDDFREDLFFRINTFEIRLPPVRDRKSDIPTLAEHMLKRFATKRGNVAIPKLTPAAIDALMNHDWPGNVRELANVIERGMILAGIGPIGPEHLPQPSTSRRSAQFQAQSHPTSTMFANMGIPNIQVHEPANSAIPGPHFSMSGNNAMSPSHVGSNSSTATLSANSSANGQGHGGAGGASMLTLHDVEMKYIQAVLEKHNGNKPAASRELGISLKTLYNKINRLQQN